MILMKLYRIIGIEEFNALMNGETLINTTDYSEMYDTNSIGFCFFANNRTDDAEKVFNTAYEYLGGIVDDYYMIEVEIDKPRKAYGYYSVGKRTEYNTGKYSLNDVRNIYRIKAHVSYINGFYAGYGKKRKYFDGKVVRIVDGIEKW